MVRGGLARVIGSVLLVAVRRCSRGTTVEIPIIVAWGIGNLSCFLNFENLFKKLTFGAPGVVAATRGL